MLLSRMGDLAHQTRVAASIQQSQACVRATQLMVSTGKAAQSYAEIPDSTAVLLRSKGDRDLTGTWLEQASRPAIGCAPWTVPWAPSATSRRSSVAC